jgi:hypothetical protein
VISHSCAFNASRRLSILVSMLDLSPPLPVFLLLRVGGLSRINTRAVVKKPSLLSPASESGPSNADTLCETRHPTSLPRGNKPLCWNYNKPGHFFSHCKQSNRVFCHVCGRSNRRATTCDCRGQRTVEPPLSESPCRRRQSSAETSRQRLGALSRKAREYQRKNKDGTGMRSGNASSEHRCYVHLPPIGHGGHGR